MHEILIYGFNDDSNDVYILGYAEDGKYCATTCKYIELENSFYNHDQKGNIAFLQYKKVSEPIKVNISLIINQLDEYLNSKDSSLRDKTHITKGERVYGLAVYEILKKYIMNENEKFDKVIPLHLVWEHKKCMSMRFQYLCSNGYIEHSDLISNYKVLVEDKSLVLRNLALQHIITGKRSILEKICHEIDSLIKNEKEILFEVYKNIETNQN